MTKLGQKLIKSAKEGRARIMDERNLKHFTIHLYEGGLTSSNQTAVIVEYDEPDEQTAIHRALVEYPDSIVTYCSSEDQ